MVITYYGLACFKIQSGEVVVLFDPPSKKTGLKVPRFRSDLVFLSHEHLGHEDKNVFSGGKEGEGAFVLDSPGEYEIKGMFIRGSESFCDSTGGAELGLNTIFKAKIEKINICHLGNYGEKEFRGETQEFLQGIDVLFVPIGGGKVIEPEQAVKIINQIEPKVVIPMDYFDRDQKGKNKILKDFLKEIGQDGVQAVEKFSFRKKDILDKKSEVVVLKSALN